MYALQKHQAHLYQVPAYLVKEVIKFFTAGAEYFLKCEHMPVFSTNQPCPGKHSVTGTLSYRYQLLVHSQEDVRGPNEQRKHPVVQANQWQQSPESFYLHAYLSVDL